jgi:hypothetical protein
MTEHYTQAASLYANIREERNKLLTYCRIAHLPPDEKTQVITQPLHEGSTGGNAVGVEWILRYFFPFGNQLCLGLCQQAYQKSWPLCMFNGCRAVDRPWGAILACKQLC